MGKELPGQSFINWLGEDKYKKLIKYVLAYIAKLDIPVMRYVPSTYAAAHLSSSAGAWSM